MYRRTLRHRQVWARIITRGRRTFAQKLARDEVQCFREAGLLVNPPTAEIISWWDNITAAVRLAIDQAKLERARKAEKLTLDHETRRLAQLGINRQPVWMAIEDNTAGYDVLSYDPGVFEPVNRLTEVKSTIASPLRFQLSRHEWNIAREIGEQYHFHIWDLQAVPPRLFERTVKEIEPHIPHDRERGQWKEAKIPVSV